jgi:CTD small phosphatase-like protein 2
MNGLVVLDIDHTLISSYILKKGNSPKEDLEKFDFSFDMDHKGNNYTVYIKKRPYLDEFLEYLKDNFNMAVFTAADRVYATKILKSLGILDSLDFFKSSESLSIGFDLVHFLVYLKKLKKIPGIDIKKTVIIDDSREVANANRKNLILIPGFYHHHKSCDEDINLLKTMSVLEKLKTEEDWTKVSKRL